MILILGSTSRSLYNFKLPLLQEITAKSQIITCGRGRIPLINSNHIHHYDLNVPLSMGFSPIKLFACLFHLAHIVNLYDFDAIYVYTLKPICLLAALSFFLPFDKQRIVLSIEGIGSYLHNCHQRKRKPSVFLRILLGKLLRISTSIHFLNNDNKEFFERFFPSSAKKSKLIPGTGISCNQWKPLTGSERARHRLLFLDKVFPRRKNPDILIFVTLARLQEDKGCLDYVNALKLLCKRCSSFDNMIFLWAGSSDWGENLVSCHDSVLGPLKYLGHYDNPVSLLQIADYYVLPSWHEGLSRSILEAMACELPVLTTDVPGCRDLICHHENGVLVSPQSPEHLSHGLLELISRFSYPHPLNRSKVDTCYSYKVVLPLILQDLGIV